MARTPWTAQLSEIRTLTPTIRELILKPLNPNEFSFQSGEFVMLHVPHGEKPALRAYSIASSSSNKKEFRLIIKLVEGGVASEFVRQLKGQEVLFFTGSFGKLHFQTPAPKQVILLCTGAGLAQHYSFLTSEALQFPNTQYHLLIGVWNEKEIFYQKELEALKKQLPHFSYEFVLDKAPPEFQGKCGHVTHYVKDFELKDTHIYLCGNPAMIKGVKECLAELSFDPAHIFAESF